MVKGVKWNAVKWIHGKPFRGVTTVPYVASHEQAICDTATLEWEKLAFPLAFTLLFQPLCALNCSPFILVLPQSVSMVLSPMALPSSTFLPLPVPDAHLQRRTIIVP